jgi:hypothetical protein
MHLARQAGFFGSLILSPEAVDYIAGGIFLRAFKFAEFAPILHSPRRLCALG